MQYTQSNHVVFSYSYTPTVPRISPNDGGFSVNLYDNDILEFSWRDTSSAPLGTQCFALPPAARMRYLALVQSNAGWLASFPQCMRLDREPRYTSFIGVDGYPLFLMEELPQLMQCPFRSIRGHYARVMYNFFEDISSIFYHFGVNITLEGFSWDANIVTPMHMAGPGIRQKSG